MQSWFSVVIPTRNSAGWIETLIDLYRSNGIRPIVLFDERSNDATGAILERSGLTVHKVAAFPFTEAIVKVAAEIVSTPWVLWMHDDEFPSEGLIRRLVGPPPPEEAQSVAIQRRWVWYQPGDRPSFGRSDHWNDRTNNSGTDHNWRLFRPDRVTYIDIMHTEGYLIDRWCRFGGEAYIAHFEWVVRSRSQRIVKLRHYDAERFGYGSFFYKVYVPEDQAPGIIDYRPVDTDLFDGLVRAYFRARTPDAPLPPLTLWERWQRLRAKLNGLKGLKSLNREPKDRIGLKPRLESEVPDVLPAPTADV